MGDEGAFQVPVKDFRSGTDDFDSWVKLFENAVKLAHKGAQAAELPELFKTWINVGKTINGNDTVWLFYNQMS